MSDSTGQWGVQSFSTPTPVALPLQATVFISSTLSNYNTGSDRLRTMTVTVIIGLA